MFEYNNLNIVDRVVKTRGKYFTALAVMEGSRVERGKG
jgi:hypothetical protein